MKTEERIKLLQKQLRTRELVENLPTLENNLEKALTDEADFRNANQGYLASSGGDCSEVKRILAEISVRAEGKNAAEREAWLTRQRVENNSLAEAIVKQREVVFLLDDHRVKIEIAKKRYESARAVLALRTAQISFLAGED